MEIEMEDNTRNGSKLHNAARTGNVGYLIQSLNTRPRAYFLTKSRAEDGEGIEHEYNIIHAAIRAGQTKFLQTALEKLDIEDVKSLLSQEIVSSNNYNAFHLAVARGSSTIVTVLVEFSRTKLLPFSPEKPWLAEDDNGNTPFFVAMNEKREDCAMALMTLGLQMVCNMVQKIDGSEISSLARALYCGFSKVADKILNSGLSYKIEGYSDMSPLDVAPYCSEEICRTLIEKHATILLGFDRNRITLLHKWVKLGKVWPFNLLLTWSRTHGGMDQIVELLSVVDSATGNNVLHTAAFHNETKEITEFLVNAYKQERGVQPSSPWEIKNNDGDTPLLTALHHQHEEIARYYISLDVKGLVIKASKSVLYEAVRNGCSSIVDYILETLDDECFENMPLTSNNNDQNVLHAAWNVEVGTAIDLLGKLPRSLVDEIDAQGHTPLDLASINGKRNHVQIIMREVPSSYRKSAWIEACERGYLDVVMVFIHHAPNFRTKCIQDKDTPLHHIKFETHNEYREFLENDLVQEFKNMPDHNNSTPLHKALEREDILLAELLLSDSSISRTIKDNSGKTATDLLTDLRNKYNEWREMCRRLGIDPSIRIPLAGSLRAEEATSLEMRGILAVVAALLATITFTAVFMLPGGLDSKVGEATLASKASFVVFILSDTYAMCCSMLVLFFLIWSMVIDKKERSLLLIELSVYILINSLLGTLVAFITAIFTVISTTSLWVSIAVIIMCAVAAVLAVSAKTNAMQIILEYLARPAFRRNNQTQTPEEERPLDDPTTRDGVNNA